MNADYTPEQREALDELTKSADTGFKQRECLTMDVGTPPLYQQVQQLEMDLKVAKQQLREQAEIIAENDEYIDHLEILLTGLIALEELVEETTPCPKPNNWYNRLLMGFMMD